MTRLAAFRGALDSGEITRGMPLSGARIESLLYYPYYCFVRRVRFRARTYLLDARTGGVSTADPFAVEWVDAPARDVLPSSLDEVRAQALAARYLPGRRVGGVELVHKPFWVVRAGSARYLVDAHTARLHPLPR